ncbi:uncharacterized protein SCODWIG_01539 [Saccharomycodes ludwigii]|uniref:Uncharacterized protein n=1 Tax=Saccharomycodes ludwigii TaxID=36035 RepID=A0A376B512_9ASCO|nr:hypothetical protein SCDLUD_000598 [Saccharomycodes ludwigii]KAH3902995.1 hypothetical protein SCDLUD_000598 [Saccharomycodes ludwigii]SSD59778.1 uncharacterized protein SCODWIG_01539 [Saccharomycodes ludwigii]
MSKRSFKGNDSINKKKKLKGTKKIIISDISKIQHLETSCIILKNLAFDNEPICSVTLSNLNIYCCLTCGKYFRGKNFESPAYQHALQNFNHKLFVKMCNDTDNYNTVHQFITLPDMELIDASKSKLLTIIQNNINPKAITINTIENKECFDFINKKKYITGCVPLTNEQGMDHVNVIIQLLSQLNEFKSFNEENNILTAATNSTCPNGSNDTSVLLQKKLLKIIRKIWNPELIKANISPIELINFLNNHYYSNQRNFASEEFLHSLNDPKSLYVWLIHHLHNKKLLTENLKGYILVTKTKIDLTNLKPIPNEKPKKFITPFYLLSVDLPKTSIFKEPITKISKNNDEEGKEENCENLLLSSLIEDKFTQPHISKDGFRCEYEIKSSPMHLLIHINRFENSTTTLKISTNLRNKKIVEFQPEMKLFKNSNNINGKNGVNYKLKCNIIYNSSDKSNTNKWSVQILTHLAKFDASPNKEEQWFEIDGLEVKKSDGVLLFLQESYFQLWERV